jgi:hypothetical protein
LFFKIDEKNESLVDLIEKVKDDDCFDAIDWPDGFQSKTKFFISNDAALDGLKKYLRRFDDQRAEDAVQLILDGAMTLFDVTGRRDFFLLHGVTASYALKCIASVLLDRNDADNSLTTYEQRCELVNILCAEVWRGLLTTFIVQKRKPLNNPLKPIDTPISVDQLREKALNIDDEHAIKMSWIAVDHAQQRPRWLSIVDSMFYRRSNNQRWNVDYQY